MQTVSAMVKLVIKKARLILLAILVFTPPTFGAFQESLWGARPASLGGAFTALADDANAPAYNPSGISLLTQSEFTLMYAQLYSGINFYAGDNTSRLGMGYFSYVPNIKDRRYGSYAISWSNFAASNLYREDSFALTVADSYQFETLSAKPIFSYGTNLKVLRRSFSTDQRTSSSQDPVFNGGRDSTAFTVDIGFMARPNAVILPGLQFGFSGQNLTEPDIGLASSDRVPARYTFGVAYRDDNLPLVNPSLELSQRNGRSLVSGGLESWLVKKTLALRVGGNEDQIGGGLGYNFKLFRTMVMKMDYALIWPLNVEGSNGSHRVSIGASF